MTTNIRDTEDLSICHNAQPGTYGHECGKPAVWTAVRPSDVFHGFTHFRSSFCDDCKNFGHEAKRFSDWEPVEVWNTEENIERAMTAYGFALRNGNDPSGNALLGFLDHYKIDLNTFEEALGDVIIQEREGA